MLAEKFDIADRVTFHGHVNDIREDIWAKNHILVMPSYYEGMPIALVEAMLSGRTAIVTDFQGGFMCRFACFSQHFYGNNELILNRKQSF